MRTLNWMRVLDTNGVEYVDRGHNVKRGGIAIKCPWCGNADPSHHMGIALGTGWWGCLRNQNHRGKSPLRLLVRLLGISYQRACDIAGITADYVDPDGFDAVAARIMGRDNLTRVEEVRRDFLHYPKEFIALTRTGRTRRFWDYLIGRGFDEYDIGALGFYYKIMAGTGGDFKDRIILPFYYNKELVAWTGRAITQSKLRYRDLEAEQCLAPPKEMLYNHDCILSGGRILIVVEGPFDAIKIDLYGRALGVRSVALATNSISDQQIYLLEDASFKFKKVLVMMDNASVLGIVDSMRMKERMNQIRNLSFVEVPGGHKDAGELSANEVVTFCKGILK